VLEPVEWDETKARHNLRKHGVSFVEAATVLLDRLALLVPDLRHSHDEDRWLVIGHSAHNRLIVVTYTERRNAVRIIGARKATARERATYEEG